MQQGEGVAAVVLIITPQGIITVKDPSKPAPVYWKFPGGHGKAGENAYMCAVREAREETGADLDITQLEEIASVERGSHTLTFFKTTISSSADLLQVGDEGEEVGVFTPQEILDMPNFMPSHYHVALQVLRDLAKKRV